MFNEIEKVKEISKLFAKSIRSEIINDPIAWVRENVISTESAISPRLDLSLSPFLIQPFMDFINNHKVKKINLMAPVGTGKSTMFVALMNYIICNDGGNAMVTFHNETEAKSFAESRLFTTFRTNKKMAHLMPKQVKNARKSKMIFPHMELYITAATAGQLQSKSIRYLVGDEVWQWDKGMVREFLARKHDRYNAKVLLVSQGGDHGTDWVREYDKGQIHHYSYRCPNCNELVQYDFRDLKYVWDEKTQDYEAFKKSVHLLTPCCKTVIRDHITERRKLSESGVYVPANNKGAKPDEISYTFNAMANFRVDWHTLAYEWIEANQAKRNGDSQQLIKFLQKRLAQNISDIADEGEKITISTVPTSMQDLKRQQYKVKCMGIDVQQDHFWFTIYGFEESNMVLLDCGRLENFDEILAKIKDHNLKSTWVMLDDGYDTDNIRMLAGKHNFFTMNGTKLNYYRHEEQGKSVEKVFSKGERSNTQGVISIGIRFSSQRVKDILKTRMEDGKFVIPYDAPKTYFKQMTNESKEIAIDKKTNRRASKWIAKANNSHMLDCTLMCLVWGMARNYINDRRIVNNQNN